MDKENLKIQSYESGVAKLPDYPSDEGYTAESLKAVFDARSDNEIKEKHNALVDAVEEEISLHTENKENPHEVTKAQVGLSNVDNTSDVDKPVSTAMRIQLDLLGNEVADYARFLGDHFDDKANPHEVTKEQLGLSNVDNTSDMDKPVSTAVQSALDDVASEAEKLVNALEEDLVQGQISVEKASCAQSDSDGNVINETYAKKEEVEESLNNLSSAISEGLSEKADILKLTTDTAKAHSITDSGNYPIVSAVFHGEADNPTVTFYGKNLLPFPYHHKTGTYHGIKRTVNDDGTITLSDGTTNDGNSTFTLHQSLDLKHGVTYSFYTSDGGRDISTTQLAYKDENGKGVWVASPTITWDSQYTLVELYIRILGNTSFEEPVTLYPMIEVGDKTNEFEPYKEPQSVTIPYTFATGDTLTIENGIVKTNISGVETDITDTEEGKALLALCTNYPNTTIVCDADCSITYKADTTNAYYGLLQKIEELKA